MTVDRISVDHVLKGLKPIWIEKTETASRLRGRIEKVLGGATAMKYRSGDNPAASDGALSHLLPPLQGISGGITASQLNASLSSSPLTTTKASYLNALLDSGALAPLQTAQVQQLLTLPRNVVTSSGVSGSWVSLASGPAGTTLTKVSGEAALKRYLEAGGDSEADRVQVAQVVFGHGARHTRPGTTRRMLKQ